MASAQNERSLSESDLDPDPHRQFRTWLDEAKAAGEPAPTAMALATVGADGLPALRMMLLEDFDPRGFVIQTISSRRPAPWRRRPRRPSPSTGRPLGAAGQGHGPGRGAPRDEMARLFRAGAGGRPGDARAPVRQSQVIADRSELERMFAESSRSGDTGLPRPLGQLPLVVATIEFLAGPRELAAGSAALHATRTSAGASNGSSRSRSAARGTAARIAALAPVPKGVVPGGYVRRSMSRREARGLLRYAVARRSRPLRPR